MYDQPSLPALLDAVRMHLETAILPLVREDRKQYFQALIAINVLKIAERELARASDHLHAEWTRLDAILTEDPWRPPNERELREKLHERNRALCAAIRGDMLEADPETLFAHLKMTCMEHLEVANPKFLETVRREEADPELDAWQHRNA